MTEIDKTPNTKELKKLKREIAFFGLFPRRVWRAYRSAQTEIGTYNRSIPFSARFGMSLALESLTTEELALTVGREELSDTRKRLNLLKNTAKKAKKYSSFVARENAFPTQSITGSRGRNLVSRD